MWSPHINFRNPKFQDPKKILDYVESLPKTSGEILRKVGHSNYKFKKIKVPKKGCK